MGKGIKPSELPDALFEEAEFDKLRRQIDASPLAAELSDIGIPLIEEPAKYRHRGLWNTQKGMWFGLDETDGQRSIIGKEIRKRSTIGRRSKQDFENIIKMNAKIHSPAPASTMLLESNAAKAFNPRGIFNVLRTDKGVARKFELLVSKRDVDPAAIESLRPYVAETFAAMQAAAIKSQHYTPFERFDLWKSQARANSNFGHPYLNPTSKDEMLGPLLAKFTPWILKIIKDDKPTDQAKWLTPAPDDANEPIYVAFIRSPNRLVQAMRGCAKLMGLFLNFNLKHMLAQFFPISWTDLPTTFKNFSRAMSSGDTVIFDDFDSYDMTIGVELMNLILEEYRESDFLSHTPDLRNAFDYFLYEATQPTRLRVSSLHTMDVPPKLLSGTVITQILGSILHDAWYRRADAIYGLGIIGWEILSDDGAVVVEESLARAKSIIENDWLNDVRAVGMDINVDKSYVASLDTEFYLGTMYGNEKFGHDTAAYLQQQLYMDSELSHGIIERAIASLQSSERDSSVNAHRAILKQHGAALVEVSQGNDISGAYYDLNRNLSILASLKPGHPMCDELLQSVALGFPNFEKRYSKFRDLVDDKLFTEEVMYAGGTLPSGYTTEWVVEYYDHYISTGKFERIWEDRQI